MKKRRILLVVLIGLLLSTVLIIAGCQVDECRGSCSYNAQYGVYGGCDSVSGGRCYSNCSAYNAYMSNSIFSTRCNCSN